MDKSKLYEKVMLVLRQDAARGQSPRASELLRQFSEVDDFAVREAIWHLLSTYQIELTPDQTLRPMTPKGTLEQAHA